MQKQKGPLKGTEPACIRLENIAAAQLTHRESSYLGTGYFEAYGHLTSLQRPGRHGSSKASHSGSPTWQQGGVLAWSQSGYVTEFAQEVGLR